MSGRGRKGAASQAHVDVRYAEFGRMVRSELAAENVGRGRRRGVAKAETARALDHRNQPVELFRRRNGIGEVLQDQLAENLGARHRLEARATVGGIAREQHEARQNDRGL